MASVSSVVLLPFPPASLSGHNTGHWRGKSATVKQFRALAADKASKADIRAPETGDITIRVSFYPPDKRGDRVNFPNRCKPIFDGIADALEVNDNRFVPEYRFYAPEKPGRVEIEVIA